MPRIIATHHGRRDSYEKLKKLLASEPFHGRLEPRLLVGNHDDRDTFRSVFASAASDPNGYVQWVEDVSVGRFIYLDTAEKGTHAGHYGESRLGWLKAELERAASDGIGAWLFMHHNPTGVHVANADRIGIVQEVQFKALLRE